MITETLNNLLHQTAFFNLDWGNYVMIAVACFFLYLAIKHEFEPLLLVPIAFGTSADAAAKKSEARYTVKGLFGREVLYTARQKDSVLTLDVPAGSATFRTTVQDMQTLLNEGVSTLVIQTEKGSTTLNLSLLVEGQKGTDRVVLRRLGENTFLTVGLRCRRDLIVGR